MLGPYEFTDEHVNTIGATHAAINARRLRHGQLLEDATAQFLYDRLHKPKDGAFHNANRCRDVILRTEIVSAYVTCLANYPDFPATPSDADVLVVRFALL